MYESSRSKNSLCGSACCVMCAKLSDMRRDRRLRSGARGGGGELAASLKPPLDTPGDSLRPV